MAPSESRSHLGSTSGMDCEDGTNPAERQDVAEDNVCDKEKELKLIAPYKRNDKIKEALLSKLKVLDDYFDMVGKIGEGTFSHVHLAKLKKDPSRRFAVKHLIPTCHPTRIIRELQCLQTIGGQDNVISVDVCLRSDDNIVFVMPYLSHEKFTNYVLKMDAAEVQLYMKNLLIALRRVHSFGIIHRDVKPSNFLYNRQTKKFLLIDFGLAQPVEELAPKINSKPEKKRKRSALSEDGENTQKKKDEAGETQAVKRPVLRPLINNSPVLRPAIRRKVKDCAASSEKSRLTTRFSASLNLSAKQSEMKAPRTSISSDVQPQEVVNRSEPSCSTQKFQRLAPDPSQTCNRFSNFLVQDSQVKEKPETSRSKNQTAEGGVFPQPTRRAPSASKTVRPCTCAGKSQICNGCMTRRAPNAARAGTPGFRPPEVLLKYQHQTTAVDIWSAGVILISILSGCSPFFRASDDVTALAEIMTIFGAENVKSMAKKLGITVLCNNDLQPYNLRNLCETLRRRKFQLRNAQYETETLSTVCAVCCTREHPVHGCACKSSEGQAGIQFPDEAFDLLHKLLELNPNERITASEALNHPFFTLDFSA